MPFYLFSLAWCLKSSIAFLKSVTLYKPLSLSSNSSLAEKETGIHFEKHIYYRLWINGLKKREKSKQCWPAALTTNVSWVDIVSTVSRFQDTWGPCVWQKYRLLGWPSIILSRQWKGQLLCMMMTIPAFLQVKHEACLIPAPKIKPKNKIITVVTVLRGGQI